MFQKFLKEEKAQGMTEYILIVALIAVAAVVVIRLFGQQISELFTRSSEKISTETDNSFGN